MGIYVYASEQVPASELVLHTATHGFTAEIYATASTPDPNDFGASHWVSVSKSVVVTRRERFRLGTGGRSYRYYLVWITKLPQDSNHASINEIELDR